MNNIKENTYKEIEIDLGLIFNIFFNSKTLIVLITLFCLVISSIYALSIKTQYESSAVIDLGQLNKNYIDIRYDQYKISNPKVTVSDYDATLRLLSTTEFSKKESEEILKAGIDSALLMINKFIKISLESEIENYESIIDENIAENVAKLEGIKRNLKNIKDKNSVISKELVRLSNLDKSLHSSSGIEGRISNLTIEQAYLVFTIEDELVNKDALEQENMKNSLEQEFGNQSYKFAILQRDIESKAIEPNRTKFIIFGLVSGFLISLIIVLLRFQFNSSLNKEL